MNTHTASARSIHVNHEAPSAWLPVIEHSPTVKGNQAASTFVDTECSRSHRRIDLRRTSAAREAGKGSGPAAEQASGRITPETGADGRKARREKLSVLLVDDSEVVRKRLRCFLASEHRIHVVGEAIDVPEALQLYQAYHPQVVILDIEMPGGSGLDVLQWIRKRSATAVVIMLSSSQADIMKPLCLIKGANHYFEKHLEFTKAVQVVRSLAESRAADQPATSPQTPD